MKSLFVLVGLLSVLLTGCAVNKPYEAVDGRDRSKLYFYTPNLEGDFLADVDLDLFIFDMNDKCRKVPNGKLELEPDVHLVETYIPAGEYVYFRISYFKNQFAIGTTQGGMSFAFKPEKDMEYVITYREIRHDKFAVAVNSGNPNSLGDDVSTADWGICGEISDPNYEAVIKAMESSHKFQELGEWESAIKELEYAVSLNPEAEDIRDSRLRRKAQNNLAKLLATCPDKKYQDGERALLLAKEITDNFKSDVAYDGTLAYAYAAKGEYDKAVEKMKYAISMMGDNHPWRKEYNRDLDRFIEEANHRAEIKAK